jgi:exonuclease SbcD
VESSVKFVLFSDLHLDARFAWTGGQSGAGHRRRRALRDTLLRIIDLAIEERVDAVLCGGDLYEHDRYSPDTLEFLRAAFERLNPIRCFIAPGNHDWYGPPSIYHRAKWSPNVHIFRDRRLEPVELTNGLTLWGAAHTAPAGTPGFLDNFRVDRGGVHLALFHGSERVGIAGEGTDKEPHAPFDANQIKESGLSHALLGHYHNAKEEEWFTYPGNPDPLSFGESGDRGAVVVTVENDGRITRTRVPVAVSQVHDLNVEVTGATNAQEIRARVASSISALRGAARVSLHGDIAPEVSLRIDDIESLPSALDSLVVRTDGLHTAYDVDVIAEGATIRGRFVRQVRDSPLTPAEQERVLTTGLRAFDGRDDLEVV